MGYFDSFMFYQSEEYFDYQDNRPIPDDFYDEQISMREASFADFLDEF